MREPVLLCRPAIVCPPRPMIVPASLFDTMNLNAQGRSVSSWLPRCELPAPKPSLGLLAGDSKPLPSCSNDLFLLSRSPLGSPPPYGPPAKHVGLHEYRLGQYACGAAALHHIFDALEQRAWV